MVHVVAKQLHATSEYNRRESVNDPVGIPSFLYNMKRGFSGPRPK